LRRFPGLAGWGRAFFGGDGLRDCVGGIGQAQGPDELTACGRSSVVHARAMLVAIIRSVDCVTRIGDLPIPPLTCQDATHWCAVGSSVERPYAAKKRPAWPGQETTPVRFAADRQGVVDCSAVSRPEAARGAGSSTLRDMWSTVLGAALAVLGGAFSVLFVAPKAASRQRAAQRWEDDVTALGDLLTQELPEAVRDLRRSWNALDSAHQVALTRGIGRHDEPLREVFDTDEKILAEAFSTWQRLAGLRLEWLVRRVEHQHTSWGELSITTAQAQLYSHSLFEVSSVVSSWDSGRIAEVKAEFESELKLRKDLEKAILQLAEKLWPPPRKPLSAILVHRKSPARN
jgi:hypothetical protein